MFPPPRLSRLLGACLKILPPPMESRFRKMFPPPRESRERAAPAFGDHTFFTRNKDFFFRILKIQMGLALLRLSNFQV